MRSLISRNKRIKIIVHQNLSAEDSWDDNCLEFSHIDRDELILSRAINTSLLDKIQFVEIFFKIAGNWKKYRISDFNPILEYKDKSIVDRLSFHLEEREQVDFDQSFRIARCC